MRDSLLLPWCFVNAQKIMRMVALLIIIITVIYCNSGSRWDGDSKQICNLFTSSNQRTNKYSQKSKFRYYVGIGTEYKLFHISEHYCPGKHVHVHTHWGHKEKKLYIFLNAYITLTWRCRGFFLVETIEKKKQHIDTLTGTAVQYNSIYVNHPIIFCSLPGFKLFSTSYL